MDPHSSYAASARNVVEQVAKKYRVVQIFSNQSYELERSAEGFHVMYHAIYNSSYNTSNWDPVLEGYDLAYPIFPRISGVVQYDTPIYASHLDLVTNATIVGWELDILVGRTQNSSLFFPKNIIICILRKSQTLLFGGFVIKWLI